MFIMAPRIKGGLQQLCHNHQEHGQTARLVFLSPPVQYSVREKRNDCGDANSLGSIAGGVVACALSGVQIKGAVFGVGGSKEEASR